MLTNIFKNIQNFIDEPLAVLCFEGSLRTLHKPSQNIIVCVVYKNSCLFCQWLTYLFFKLTMLDKK